MPWHGEPMKDVESRDSLGGAAHRRYYPQVSEWGNLKEQSFTSYEVATGGTETSKYPEERKSKETSLVAASEREQA